MAETVVSTARVLLGSAISKAASAAADEASLLLGVQKDLVRAPCNLTPPAVLLHSVTPPFLFLVLAPPWIGVELAEHYLLECNRGANA